MGTTISVDPGTIAPSQDFIKEKTVGYIIRCYAEENEGALPPTPIVRRGAAGELVAIDGHNLLVVNDLLGKPQEVYVAASADDGFTHGGEGVRERNEDLRVKFDSVIVAAEALKERGIATVRDLRLRQPSLQNIEETEQHFGVNLQGISR